MERLERRTKNGINSNALRALGMLFAAAGIAGRGVIQNHLLNVASGTTQQLLEALQGSEDAMTLATAAIALQAIETCAVPIFCFLLVEGFQHTKDAKQYFLRVLGLALISEIPYNLVFSGKLLDMSSRNPVFSMALCLVVLLFYRSYAGQGGKGFAVKTVITAAAVLWVGMLSTEAGIPCLLLTVVLWASRSKPIYRNLAGCAAAMFCGAMSPFYLASPMSFMAVYFYNGEKGADNRLVNYLAYPALLLVAVAANFIL